MLRDPFAKLTRDSRGKYDYESCLFGCGYSAIAGVDEVGRGPLAGPVVAAAVILPVEHKLVELDDSKALSISQRERLYNLILQEAVAIGTGSVDNHRIDQVNILNATKLSMMQAVESLSIQADFLLIDGMVLEGLDIPQKAIIKGDALCYSIAAASIIAKVTRDRLMEEYHKEYPQYDFHSNKGYPTPAHKQALERIGPCPLHRMTFSGVNTHGRRPAIK